MDPENPPRRTRPEQEPLTIDLHATPDPDAAHRLDATSAEGEHVPADDGAGAEAAAEASAEAEAQAKRAEDSRAEAERADEAEREALKTREADQEARAEAAAAAFTEEPAPSRPTGTPLSQPAAKPSTSGALAAGIVGGLIALAGAGVLQYAGVLPAIGPAATSGTSSGRDLAAEIDALKSQAPSSDAGSTAALEQRLAAVEQSVGGAGDTSNADALKTQVASLTQELEQVKSGLADQQKSAQTATSELSTRIEEAEKKLDEPASDVQLARAIAVTALKTSIDRGGPFLAELDALKSISPDDPAIAGLADLAPRGVSSRNDLTRTFPDTADAMLAAIRGADPNQGVFSRLMSSAASAVRVRPVGSVDGTGPEAVVARIEDRLTNGDLKGASLEWDGLPQPAKDAGADFRTKLDERIKAEGLIDTAVSGAASGSASAKQG